MKQEWKVETLYHEGDLFFQRLISEIAQAQKTIYLETYIFQFDELGVRLLDALQAAAKRGVRVYLIVDGVGSLDWNEEILKQLSQKQIFARIYHPLPWVFTHPQSSERLPFLKRWALFFRKLNRRNHRKVCIIDEWVAWVGSFNVSSWHLREFKGDKAWRDSGLRIQGSEVSQLCQAFQRTWFRSRGCGRVQPTEDFQRCARLRNKKRRFSELVRLNDSRISRRRFYKQLIGRIYQSSQKILIVNAYFIPTRRFVKALLVAARKDLEIKIVVPQKTDVRLTRWVMLVIAEQLMKRGIKVFEYLPRVLHAKFLILDRWATVGSTNFNHRSFIHDLEVDIVLSKPESVVALEEQLSRDLAQSQELVLKRYGLKKFFGRIFFFLRYWM